MAIGSRRLLTNSPRTRMIRNPPPLQKKKKTQVEHQEEVPPEETVSPSPEKSKSDDTEEGSKNDDVEEVSAPSPKKIDQIKETKKLAASLENLSSSSGVDPNIAAIMKSIALLTSQSCASQTVLQNSLALNSKPSSVPQEKDSASWSKLDDSIRSTILTAMTDGIRIPTEPTEGFKMIIRAKNGAVIKMRLHQKFSDHIMDLDCGMCTALSKGLILSLPDSWAISNLLPFFTPSDSYGNLMSENLLQLEVQTMVGNGLGEKELKLLTKQISKVPTNVIDLIYQIQNFCSLIGELFGKNSLLYKSLMNVSVKCSSLKREFKKYFDQHSENFGFQFLHLIHVGTQIYLKSCAHNKLSKLDDFAIDFNSFFREIQLGSFVVKARPSNKRKQEDENTDPDKKRMKSDNQGEAVINNDVIAECKIQPGNRFGKIFHPHNKREFNGEIPKINGKEICHKFHSLGCCHDKCKLKASHVKLPAPCVPLWKEFFKFCKRKSTGEA